MSNKCETYVGRILKIANIFYDDERSEIVILNEISIDMNKNYNIYRHRYEERYWDTKENHAYYSLPMTERAWLTIKKVS